MRHIKNLVIILAVLFSIASCKKSFLEIEDNSFVNRQTYVKDLASMEHFVNGIYIMLNRDYEHGIAAAYPELVADNLMPRPLAPSPGSGTQSLIAHYRWSQQAQDRHEYRAAESAVTMNGIWTTGYLIIRACSFVIEDVDKYRGENAAKADHLKGQAYAIRAMVHFKLVNIFAQTYKFSTDASHPGVPYITTSDITAAYSRQTVAEVYNGITSDLGNAIELLPISISDIRFMNRLAAKGILASVALFKEDFNTAKTLAKEVADQVALLTIANGYPDGLFMHKTPSQTEVLFQLAPMNYAFTPNITNFIGRYLRGSSLRYRATNDIASILKENPTDIRGNWVANSGGLWNVIKYPTGVATNVDPAITVPETSYYPPIIRSSEVFLIVAEASAKTNDETSARTYLNAIRQRSDPAIVSVSATGQALIDSIYKERRKELCFEGLRMFDLQRWKLGVHRTHIIAGAPSDLPFPSDKAIAPIHLKDVQIAGIPQNPGY